ncbi:hypothetical protein FSP39_011443 [Pinctada imbricata]|uniref:Vimentin-type intermediate filament-associated coiled-coil protein n=1 Tax=Pinctada imbricata TaxID=66713 RepID=A0AA89BWW1_PINIB|nr:hypothetical protein FSP39_011443 [Pinctada imbricata]
MLSRTSIDEANRHLLAMHERVSYLEKVVQEQNQALLDKDSHLQHKMAELERIKVKEIQNMKGQMQDLQEEVSQKDAIIQRLQEEASSMKKVYAFLPHLKQLVNTMENTCPEQSENNTLVDEQGDHRVNGVLPEGSNFRLEPMNVSSLAKHYVTNHRSRNFSISEDDSDLEVDVSKSSTNTNRENSIKEESQQKDGKDKEYYL